MARTILVVDGDARDPASDGAARADEGGPVTVVVSRRVRSGRADEFEAWVRGVTHEAMKFPGHLGVDVIRPVVGQQPVDYHLVFRFDSVEGLRAWQASPVCADWIARVRPLTEGDPGVKVVSGLEYWFTPPGATPPAPVAPPPRYKMAAITWLAIVPLAHLLPPVVARGLGGGVPSLVRTMAVATLMIAAMTYGVMPLLVRAFAPWLFPRHGDDRDPGGRLR